uniref:Uncharacterized protein n=1 Tax=Odontella aurita TaxID=265563 RepID=A0A6U6LE20_9STRA|mmetsp:Transcript_7959/g.23578  ORF Transcript_7959/g.23578 Transcript_7959/m.23578 type:complete len:172 (+) Transcript_7959:349-864(+)|eukprot:CAMPEP_0113529498 /NCGR_PEP_ID=MMETSP0015_2-20120614/2430_1 /TAXON_ID=2838 /ORGANISM="Odontella" /LENGTH=171 /DNA_ID=CAMNT_0000428141 /DNA_START=275 /DNA_END=790 /DNA_ORIENTATION=- /assembly_acc=CAM_ASM_000160
MHFRITIPPNVKPGQTVRIRCPDGTEGDVRVPKNLKAGDDFIFEMSGVDEDKVREISRQLDDFETTKSGGGGGGGGEAGGAGGVSAKKKGGGHIHMSSEAATKAAANLAKQGALKTVAGRGGGVSAASFLDREIINRQDFLTALAIGMMIGLSIVGGFLVGVLLVTDPTDE